MWEGALVFNFLASNLISVVCSAASAGVQDRRRNVHLDCLQVDICFCNGEHSQFQPVNWDLCAISGAPLEFRVFSAPQDLLQDDGVVVSDFKKW